MVVMELSLNSQVFLALQCLNKEKSFFLWKKMYHFLSVHVAIVVGKMVIKREVETSSKSDKC